MSSAGSIIALNPSAACFVHAAATAIQPIHVAAMVAAKFNNGQRSVMEIEKPLSAAGAAVFFLTLLALFLMFS